MNTISEPEHHDCRTRLMQAATEAFIEHGYRASIEQVALRAGVARQTLYNHFPSKDELISEVIRQVTSALLVTLDIEAKGLRERLLRFGLAFRSKVLSAEGLGFYRSMLAEAARQPKVAADFYNAGPAQTEARLRSVLAAAMERGELCKEDPAFATTILLSMLIETERSNCLLKGDPPPAPDAEHVGRIIDYFLRAFAPESSPQPVPQRSNP